MLLVQWKGQAACMACMAGGKWGVSWVACSVHKAGVGSARQLSSSLLLAGYAMCIILSHPCHSCHSWLRTLYGESCRARLYKQPHSSGGAGGRGWLLGSPLSGRSLGSPACTACGSWLCSPQHAAAQMLGRLGLPIGKLFLLLLNLSFKQKTQDLSSI